jgi:hypothetical protein
MVGLSKGGFMTPAQKKFVELERKKVEIKKYFEELKMAIEEVEKEIGINGHFQDETGCVYQIVVPEGKFITFEKISYVRTRRKDEKKGDLSLKKAEELGYNVKE